jgi:hypothetical protein
MKFRKFSFFFPNTAVGKNPSDTPTHPRVVHRFTMQLAEKFLVSSSSSCRRRLVLRPHRPSTRFFLASHPSGHYHPRQYSYSKMSAFSNPSLVLKDPVPSDIEISQSIAPLPIDQIAEQLGLLKNEVYLYGPTKCKVSLDVRKRLENEENGNYIVVTGINPTP